MTTTKFKLSPSHIYGPMITTVLLSILLLSSALGAPLESGAETLEPTQVININYTPSRLLSIDLERVLADESGLESELDVIIQFNKQPAQIELDELSKLGFRLRQKFRVLNAVSGNALGAEILAISSKEFVSHIEINYPMKRDMEMSLSVVNATRAWDSQVIRNEQLQGYIDGTGVTVCVVDTGIDAGHPDLDYGEKTLFNLHDLGNGNFVEMENSDVNFGHGTHVAGTVAGNGDASAGARSGVAPGANLIGLSVSIPEQMSDPTMETYISGLEWIYENTRPGNNPYNIRCATNSWHATVGEYDPDMALTVITEKLTYENNVLTTWSAGNDGRDDPEGTQITTSQQGNTPVAIMVAAYERDGSAVTDFSSRGQVGWNHTYPDLGGPGRSIWSCAARRTMISGGSYVGGNDNPYYLAISGTSMSTPHIAGTVALLWQAAPSMRVSYIHEDYSGEDASWWTNPRTRAHEAELILEASCKYLEPIEEHGVLVGNKSSLPGWNDRLADYVQGYGIVDVQKAVGIALALEELRTKYPEENITVFDAIENFQRISQKKNVEGRTNVLTTHWSGEFSRFQSSLGIQLSSVNQTKKLLIPEGANNVNVDLFYAVVDRGELKATNLAITIDYGDDGSIDYTGELSGSGSGVKSYQIDATGNAGMVWTFDLIGQGIKLQNPFKDKNYVELRCEYDITVNIIFSSDVIINFTRTSSIYSDLKFDPQADSDTTQVINKTVHLYDLSKVVYIPPFVPEPPEERMDLTFTLCLAGLGMVVIILIAIVAYRRLRKRNN